MKLSLAVLLLAALPAACLNAAEKLNVLLIISDDLRDTVGCYGNASVKTPHIDKLAKRGVRFERAYVQYPVCNPSRSSFLTGLRCEQTGVVGNTTLFRTQLPEIVTLPQLLRQNGWYAASFGKVFHAGEAMGEAREGWMDTGKSWDTARMFKPTEAATVLEGRNLTDGKLKWCEWGATGGSDDDQPDGQNALHAIKAIEKAHADGTPWIVAAGFHRPHDPFLVPKKYFDLYPPGTLKVHHDPPDVSPARPLTLPGGAFAEAFNSFTDAERAEFLRAYYAGVSFMDAQVGRLMETLDRLKLWNCTLVVFMGDNGYHHNERNWWNKATLFERSCRVPFIVVAPDGPRGQACRGLIEMVDLYPTVADYCDLRAPHQLAGQTLRPLLQNPERKGRDAAFTLVTRGANLYGQAVRTENWRYVQWSDGHAELYDQRTDPQEIRDVSGAPEHAEVIREHKSLLARVGPYNARPGGRAPRKSKERIKVGAELQQE